MIERTFKRVSLVLLGLVLCGTPGVSAESAIGLVVANGPFELNHARVWNNASLFDGVVIETSTASSKLHLNSGVDLRLSADSRARVYQKRLVLEKGTGELASANYSIEAATLHISSDAPGVVALVRVDGSNRAIVAARQGSVNVTNIQGVLVARLETGRELAFEPQAAGAPTKISGCLLRKSDKLIVADQTTNVIIQVQGAGLEKELGNRVEITGSVDSAAASVTGASQLINVSDITHVATGGCAVAAKTAGAVGAGAAAAGISGGVLTAVVGGVSAVGIVAGLGIAGTFSGKSSTSP